MAIGGPIESVTLAGREFAVAADADSNRKLGGFSNEVQANDYGSQAATGLVPGADGDQWTNSERDEAVKKGSSTIEVKDGQSGACGND